MYCQCSIKVSHIFLHAGYLKELAKLEKQKNIRPSPVIDAFMKVIIQITASLLPIMFSLQQILDLSHYISHVQFSFSANNLLQLKQNSPAQASSVQGKKQSLATDYILRVLGLDVCAETLVGSDMVRGVSGGQRKRVTTGF